MKSFLPRCLFCCAILLLPVAGRAELLLGFSWSSPDQLEQIADLARSVRYVTSGKILISGDRTTLERIERQGIEPFLVDSCGPGESYYLTHLSQGPLPASIPLYQDPSGWVLLRMRPGDEGYALPYFLYPLPENYALRGWIGSSPRPKPTAQLDRAVMADLLAQVDEERIRHHIHVLALKDPDAPSTYDNLRTRFAVRPEIRQATEYIRSQLAEALGEDAVQVQTFQIDPRRLSAHLGGRVGEGPVDFTAYNVVGVLPGTDPEAGYYVICAHYDATAVRTPHWNWRTDPAPGADDNGTGAALVMECARVLAGRRFPWSIRFIAFSGEELGLLGSRAYAVAAADSGHAILGVLNFDMFGYNDLVDRIELATNPASRWLADLMVEANQEYEIGLRVDVLEDPTAGLSDHASFWARGYDAILAIENYLPTDSTTYAVRQGLYRINAQNHNVADVPDSINWRLVRKSVQLAVATLAQYESESGLPDLAVFTGDLRYDGQGHLLAWIANTGTGRVGKPFRVRLSHCDADSTGCRTIYEGEPIADLAPGEASVVSIPWSGLGEAVFLLEVDPDERIAERREDDNRTFQWLYLQPQDRVAVYPNPFRPEKDEFLVFAGLPLKARVSIFSLDGNLVWSAQEDDALQRRWKTKMKEVRWPGVNQSGLVVNSGIYLYRITTPEGKLLEQRKLAVIH